MKKEDRQSPARWPNVLLVIANIALVIVTAWYLCETRAMRRIAESSFRAQNCPKVFLESIKSVPRLNRVRESIQVSAIVRVKNVGNVEATDFFGEYTLSHGDTTVHGKIGPVPYLFPSQGVQYTTSLLEWGLSKENFAVVKEAIEMKKSLVMSKDPFGPISLDFTLNYSDQQGEDHILPYTLQYIFHDNAWVFVTQSEDANSS